MHGKYLEVQLKTSLDVSLVYEGKKNMKEITPFFRFCESQCVKIKQQLHKRSERDGIITCTDNQKLQNLQPKI